MKKITTQSIKSTVAGEVGKPVTDLLFLTESINNSTNWIIKSLKEDYNVHSLPTVVKNIESNLKKALKQLKKVAKDLE